MGIETIPKRSHTDEEMSAGETTALGGACQTEYEVSLLFLFAPQAGE